MSGSVLEALLDVREWSKALPNVREWSRGSHGCLGVVGRPTRMCEFLGDPPGCLGVVGRPSRMSGSGQEAFPDIREWSGVPSGSF